MSKFIESSPPAVEPVDLAEMRAALRSESDVDDAYLAELIKAARSFVERRIEKPVISRDVHFLLEAWPADDVVTLPEAPVEMLNAAFVERSDGSLLALDTGSVILDPSKTELLVDPMSVPVLADHDRVRVDLRVGFGAAPADVPSELRQAVRLLTAHWYERREPLDGEGAVAPFGFDALIAPFMPVRL